ncbi:MAG: hypothetical protein ACJAXQ_000033 [Parvibaculaceae bacterium]|jgi:hypothetical protein
MNTQCWAHRIPSNPDIPRILLECGGRRTTLDAEAVEGFDMFNFSAVQSPESALWFRTIKRFSPFGA